MRGVRRALTQLQLGPCGCSSMQPALPSWSGEALQGSCSYAGVEQRHPSSRVTHTPRTTWGPTIMPWAVQQRSLFGGLGAPTSKKYNQRRLVGWSADQLYKVVSDVDQYHKFVPWCQRSCVTKRSEDGKFMEAELEVGFQVLVERYVSQVTLRPPRAVQSTVHNSMLFHHLDSSWSMEAGPSPGTCWLSFDVDFAFNSALYGHLADVFFSEVVQRMIGAFESRCHQLYGPSNLIKLHQHQHRNHHCSSRRGQQGPGQHSGAAGATAGQARAGQAGTGQAAGRQGGGVESNDDATQPHRVQ